MTKAIQWMGSSRRDLRAFPADVRGEAGFQLRMVQVGEAPVDWKPMRTVGPGVIEIRIHRQGEFRVLYVTKSRDVVYVLHCFQKKTPKTGQRDIDIAKRRYAEMTAIRRGEGAQP